MSAISSTKVLRVPEATHNEATHIAALRGSNPGELIAEAWREYIEKHREEFAADLEKVAKLMRDGTLEQLAEFTSRNAKQRAAAAVEKRRSRKTAAGEKPATNAEPAQA